MIITTVQWNIGGGKLLSDESDPKLLASYSNDGLNNIINYLKQVDADIITLQEVHKDSETNQAELIASELGLDYCISDFYADSHIEEGQRLGHAIVSRYPISQHQFELYTNPNLKVVWEDGTTALSHDKGVTKCLIELEGATIETMTTHFTPFRRFGIDLLSEQGQSMLSRIQDRLTFSSDHVLLQGDFNIDSVSLEDWLPTLFKRGMDEILLHEATTPKEHKFDHVLFRNLNVISSTVDNSVKTDHFPVLTKFELS